ncbi:MAG TPA: hypothetical protein PK864_02425 [Syntrophorhabdaceae bacterium]|nr:hypothetical protein [Syntrophorhabdaceae bacterium]HOT41493.1 hypothetical protein [Syntrophorhabdaceae bacterium]HPC65952.1 hypothetical protein [Syntrophorhabdaceae bacterium]HQE79234.1 hypothetical protein [Syntrophorhabdaceae bacterium]HQH42423.1 hypothetical protein [Syntrophorhabdaceae bacterium]
MAKKKEIKEIKQPDFLMKAIAGSFEWIKNNLRACIVGAAVVVLIVAGLVTYIIYENKKDERIQGLFVQGMQAYREYTITGKEDTLNKAEGIFNSVASESGKKMKALSKLYLGRIYYLKGKKDEAIKAYKEAQTLSDAEVVKILSQKALDSLKSTP